MLNSTLLFMSPGDITLILVVALVFFGGKKLPELARGLGQGIKEFKDATDGKADTPQPPVQQTPPPAPPVYQAPPVQPPVHQAPPTAEHKPSDLPEYTPVNQTHPPAQQ